MTDLNGDPELAAVLVRLSERARHKVTLADLIRRWSDFSAEVLSGYRASIYDYTNELTVRDLLAEVIAALRPELAHEVETRIAQADGAYRNGTRISERPLLPMPPRVNSWWWFRVPTKAGTELRRDLVSDGFGEPDRC